MGRGGCGCSKVGDEEEEEHDPSYSGPIKSRSCTDVVCLLLLIVFVAGWIVISVYAFMHGNPAQLIYPSNSRGEICGTGVNRDKPYLLFFDLTRCIKLSAALGGCATPQVCVQNCPQQHWSYVMGSTPDLKQYCTRLSPGEFEGTDLKTLVRARKCPAYILKSTKILGRCVPTLGLFKSSENQTKEVSQLRRDDDSEVKMKSLSEGIEYLLKVIDLRGIGEKLISDLTYYWWIIVIAVIFAMILSFLWIVLLRMAAVPMIWFTILLCILLLASATSFSWYRYYILLTAGDQADADEIFLPPLISTFSSYYYNKDLWLGISIIMSILTFIILVILFFLRSRISLAIDLIEEGSKAVGSNMATLFFPIGPFLCQTAVVIWFCVVASFLASSGEPEYSVVDVCKNMTCTNPETEEPYYKHEKCDPDQFTCPTCPEAKCVFYKLGPSTLQAGFQVYNVFALFWLLFFVEALGEMVLAGVFAGWYWTFDKENDLPSSPILSSLQRTVRYHLGTLAFGSLVLSIVRMIRVIIEYVEDKLKQYGEDSAVVKAVTCLCKCCFYCLENCIRFLNRNAYIMTAVYGYSFCAGARKAFFLLARNIVRVTVLDKVTDFILFIGKLIVVALVIFASAALFNLSNQSMDHELNYQLVPLAVIAFSTYAIASSFFSVYSMAVDVIFLSFLEDSEKHDGSAEKPYFMSPNLRSILGDSVDKKSDEEEGNENKD